MRYRAKKLVAIGYPKDTKGIKALDWYEGKGDLNPVVVYEEGEGIGLPKKVENLQGLIDQGYIEEVDG